MLFAKDLPKRVGLLAVLAVFAVIGAACGSDPDPTATAIPSAIGTPGISKGAVEAPTAVPAAVPTEAPAPAATTAPVIGVRPTATPAPESTGPVPAHTHRHEQGHYGGTMKLGMAAEHTTFDPAFATHSADGGRITATGSHWGLRFD